MPYQRPTLTTLRTQVSRAIQSALPGSDAALRFGVLSALANADAGLAYEHYSYLAWIARQAVPYTAEEEFLEAWAALKDVFRLAPTQATGTVQFTGTVGKQILAGTPITRSDGQPFTSTADAAVASTGVASVPVKAVADPQGLVGAIGNTPIGVSFSLSAPINGVQGTGTSSSAIIGGTDLELDDSLRARMLEAYQAQPEGGSQSDYEKWARDVPGVTRAWVNPNGAGPGTVVVYFMMDDVEAAYGGFPQGTDGASQYETRATAATGDQLTVANALWGPQPVTALVYAVSPIAAPQNFTISGLSSAGAIVQGNVDAAIAATLKQKASPGGTVNLSDIEAAISAVPGTPGFIITSPTSNITETMGNLTTLGSVAFP